MARRGVLWGMAGSWAVLILACGPADPAPPASAEGRPNVLLVTWDTTRTDHLSCYGYGEETTPVLDALAARSVRFEQASSTSGLTSMAHGSILTGLNPYRHGMRVFFGPTGHRLKPELPTLAQLLGEQGYATAAFVSAFPASDYFGLGKGFDTFDSGVEASMFNEAFVDNIKHEGAFVRERESAAQRRGDATADRALEWLRGTDGPFFLWVHLFDPHEPALIPPKEVTDRFLEDIPEPTTWPPKMPKRKRIKVYDAEIYYMDLQLQRLLELLAEKGCADDTILVVMADHGQGLQDHGWYRHRLLYQEQIRIPLVLSYPGAPAGKVIPWRVRNVDVMPTILELTGVEGPGDLDGKSLLPLVRGEEAGGRLAFAEALNTLDSHAPKNLPPDQKDLLFALLDDRYKLIYHKNQPRNSELYDLQKDPRELQNLYRIETEVRDRLLRELRQLGAMEITVQEPEGELDEAARRALEALGYVAEGDDEDGGDE